MPNVYFFATRSDQKAIIDFVTNLEGVRVFESYSELGRELREFRTFDELASAYEVGVDKYGNGFGIGLTLWWPDVDPHFEIRRINLNPKSCRGHTVRWCVKSSAAITLHLGGLYEQTVTHSNFCHFSEAGARGWGKGEGVDWAAVKKISGKIQYHIRKRLAVDRTGPYSILPEAFSYVRQGYKLQGVTWEYEAPPLSDEQRPM